MSKHALAGIIGQRERQVITGVVDQVGVVNTQEALKIMPVKNVPSATLIWQKVSNFGGMTGERAFDTEGKSIPGRSRKTFYFDPGLYQESIRFNERDILRYSKLGTIGERGVTSTGLSGGQLDELSMAAEKLKLRMETRMSVLIWAAIFTGTYTYQGEVYDFQIPTANKYQSYTDWSVTASSTPFYDLYNMLAYDPTLLRYTIKELIMNPKTFALMMQSQQTRDVLKNYNLSDADPNKVGQLVAPGLPPIRVIKDAYRDESYAVAGDGSPILGNAQFMIPDFKVLLIPDLGGLMYTQLGEFQVTENMNAPEATIERPAQGVYTFINEKGLEQKKNPFVEIVAGFNGAPNLMRSDDVFVLTVKVGA